MLQRALKSPIAFFKGGDISQLGGDFVLGPGGFASVSTVAAWVPQLFSRESLFLRITNALDHRSYVCHIRYDERAGDNPSPLAFTDVEVPDLMAAASVAMPK